MPVGNRNDGFHNTVSQVGSVDVKELPEVFFGAVVVRRADKQDINVPYMKLSL